MAVAEMSRVTVLGHKKLKKGVVKTLTESGAAEITKSPLFDGLKNSWASESDNQERRDKITFVLDFLKRIKKEAEHKPSFGRENLLLNYSDFDAIREKEEELFEIIADCHKINTALTDNNNEKIKLKNILFELQPYLNSGSDGVSFGDVENTTHAAFVFGTVENGR